MANIKCTIHHLGRIFISLDEKKINKQTNERTISNPCFRYKRQMKIFFAPSFNIYLLFMRYCMYSMVVCFLFSTSVRSHLMRSLCFHVLLPSPIHWFESVFLSKLFSWIYWFATSSAFSPIIISASFIFVFIFFLLFFRLVLLLLLLLLFFFSNFNQQRNVILLTLYNVYNSMLLSDVIVSFHQLKMPLLCVDFIFCCCWYHSKRFTNSIPSYFGDRKKNINKQIKMYWNWIDADTRDFQLQNLHFKWNIGKPFKNTHTHALPHIVHFVRLISARMQCVRVKNVVKLLFNRVVCVLFCTCVFFSVIILM